MIRRIFTIAMVIFLVVVLFASVNPVLAAINGRITGKIVEASTKAPLTGANVMIKGTTLGAVSDRQGYYLISNVPPGNYVVVVSYIGYEKGWQADVRVVANETTELNFELRSSVIELGALVVTAGRLAQSQATALNIQRNAPNIKSVVASDLMGTFPDPNAVEAMSRIPGISITRDQGEGRFAILRGMDPRFGSTTIDGERVPSAESKERFIALDAIPADLIERIEVSKALTADMDADAIGGSVNLIMKDAPDCRIFLLTTGYGLNEHPGRDMGYNNSQPIQRISVATGDTLIGGKLGYLISGSYYKTFMSTDNREYTYDFENDELPDGVKDAQKRDYEIYRRRMGVNGKLLYKPWLGHRFYAHIFWSSFGDQEQRWRKRIRYNKEKTERELKFRWEEQRISNFSLGGDHTFMNNFGLDYHFTYTKSIGNRNPDRHVTFVQKFENADQPFVFDKVKWNDRDIEDRNFVGALNIRVPFLAGGIYGTLSAGTKFRSKDRFVERVEWEAEAAEGEDDWELPGGPDTDQFPSDNFQPPIDLTFSNSTNPADNYSTKERIIAGYAQAEVWIGNQLMFLPGVRVERTELNYNSDIGAPASNDYTNVLPVFHVRYKIRENTNIRLAVTKALNRPNYYELVPYDYIDDDERFLGNPDLKPAISTNFDLLFEHFSPRGLGVISAGVFYKQIVDPVEIITWTEPGDISVYQPQNSGDAFIKGFEVALQQRLGFIGLRNIGISCNYVYADSKVDLEMRKDRPLTGQSKHVANVALSYEHPRFGFSGQVALQFKGRQLESAGEAQMEDAYETDYTRLDLKLSQKVSSGIRFYLEGRNLTNAPLHFVVVDPTGKDKTLQKEYYGRSFSAGFNLEL